MVHDYLMGQRRAMSGLMAWNADATRLPSRMHSGYLRWLYLGNDLARGLATAQPDLSCLRLAGIRAKAIRLSA